MIKLNIESTIPEEIELIQRYWAIDEEGKFRENVADLLPFRHIRNSTQLASFVREVSQAWDTNQVCAHCGGFEEVKSRSEVKKTFLQMRSPCTACLNAIEEERRVAQAEANERLCSELAKAVKRAASARKVHDELPDDIVLLLIALERAVNPRLLTGTFTRSDCRLLAPTYVSDFLTKLYRANAITDAPAKAKEGVYILKDERLVFYTDKADYFFTPDPLLGNGEAAFSAITARPLNDNSAIRNLWLDYAAVDCMAYLFDQCAQHGFTTSSENDSQIHSTLRTALQTYSIAQLWSAIWRVVRDAITLSARPYYTDEKAAATIPNKLLRLLEKVAAGQAELKAWTRPELQPAGTLGNVFAEYFGIDENTSGSEVMSYFADRGVTGDDSSLSKELSKTAKQLFSRSIEQDVSAEVLVQFADYIRSGLSVEESMKEILIARPNLK